ncbi:MAG: COP23 domain-containing protein [Hormoscilla sp.]
MNKIKSLGMMIAGAIAAIGLGVVASPHQHLRAQPPSSTSYYCGRDIDGVPATIAKTRRGNIPLIRWKTEYFSSSGWTPSRRCQEVSMRFENYNQQGKLAYITTGEEDGYPIICVAEQKDGPCINKDSGELLLTLRKDDNPNTILVKLLRVRDSGSNPLEHAIRAAYSLDAQGRVHIAVEPFLSRAPNWKDRQQIFGQE